MIKIYYIVFIAIVISLSSCLSRKHYSSESYFASSNLERLNGEFSLSKKQLYEYFNINSLDYEVNLTNKYYGAYETIGDILNEVDAKEIFSRDRINLDFILLNFNGKDSLSVVYRDSEFWYKKTYRGKLKKNYFEITLQNMRFPFFPIISRHDVDKIKIGLNQAGEVVVRNYSEHWGTFLLFGAHSGGDEYSIILKRIESPNISF